MIKHIEIGIAGKDMRDDSVLWIRDLATKIGIRGAVSTKSDGSIKVVAQGEEEDLEYLSDKIEHGGIFSEIDNFYANWSEPSEELEDFFVVIN